MDEKSVFIGYRRDQVGKLQARALQQALERQGWDVFLDVDSLDAGAWEEQIARQIRARPNFILLLTPGALDRCASEDDFLRREYELAKSARRNLVPVQGEDYDLRAEQEGMRISWGFVASSREGLKRYFAQETGSLRLVQPSRRTGRSCSHLQECRHPEPKTYSGQLPSEPTH